MDGELTATRPTGPRAVLGGRYHLGELIGAGGMAEVRRARDLRLGRDVAVKLLSGHAAADPSRRRRIEREARALAATGHANIVAVYDYGEERTEEEDVLPYVVMELVDGTDLEAALGAGERFSLDESLGIMRDVLDAVDSAHTAGVVHGDLKPANVLLYEHGAKVADFGVARVLGEETGATTVAATPSYAAPEVLRGARPTKASDVYSAGCLAFRILAGRPPYEGDGAWDVAAKHIEASVPSVCALRPDVPEAVDNAVRRAMAKDPRSRFPSAEAFANALRTPVEAPETTPLPAPPPAARAEPTEVLPVAPTRRRRPWRSRLIGGALAAAGALFVVLSLTGLRSDAVTVPDVRGRAVSDAAADLRQAGLAPAGVSYLPAADEGEVVLRTIPAAGEEVRPGAEIHLLIALPTPEPAPPPEDGEKVGKDENRGRGNRARGDDD